MKERTQQLGISKMNEEPVKLSELSEVVRKGVIGTIRNGWEFKPVEDKIHYLRNNGLADCYAAGVEVPQSLLDAAGIGPEEDAEAKAEAARALALPPETEEFKKERMRQFYREEREKWDKLSFDEKVQELRRVGLDIMASGVEISDDLLKAAGKSKEHYEWAYQMARQMKYFPHEDFPHKPDRK